MRAINIVYANVEPAFFQKSAAPAFEQRSKTWNEGDVHADRHISRLASGYFSGKVARKLNHGEQPKRLCRR